MGMPEMWDRDCEECGCFGSAQVTFCEECFKQRNEKIKSELGAEFGEDSNIFFRIKMVLRKVGVLDSSFHGSGYKKEDLKDSYKKWNVNTKE